MSYTEIQINAENIEDVLTDIIPADELSEMDLDDMFDALMEHCAKYKE